MLSLPQKVGLESLAGEVRDGASNPVLGRASRDGEHGQAAVLELLEPQLVQVRLRPGRYVCMGEWGGGAEKAQK